MKNKISKFTLFIVAVLLVFGPFSTAFAIPVLNQNTIEKIYVGNEQFGDDDDWNECSFSDLGNGSYAAALPGTYQYVKVETIRWRLPTDSQSWLLDGEYPRTSDVINYYDSNGNVCTPGSIIYGKREYTIWEIPEQVPTSEIVITLVNSGVVRRLSCEITWEGGVEAPSTPYLESYNSDTVTLSGTDSTMEYRIAGEAEWTVCGTEQLLAVGEEGINVDVRYAGAPDVRPSDSAGLTMNRGQAPMLVYNETDSTISGVDNTMEYCVDAAPYADITDNILDVSELVTSDPKTIYVRYKGDSGLASRNWAITVASIPLAPTTPYYSNSTSYVLAGVTNKMEVRINNEGEWYPITGTKFSITDYVSETDSTIFEVRYKATEDQPASAVKVINVDPLRLPPIGAYRTGNTIYGLRPGLLYRLHIYDNLIIDRYYTGTVSSNGTCTVSLVADFATYEIRYMPQDGLDYSPWIKVVKR